MMVIIEKMTIPTLLEGSYRRYADLPALASVGDAPFSYRALQAKVQDVMDILQQRNVRKGERVAILGDNSPNWVIAYMATVSMGAVAVPILTGFPGSDTRHILRNSEAVVLFIDQKQREKITEGDDSSLHTVAALEDFSVAPYGRQPGFLEKTLGLFRRGRGQKSVEPEPDDPAVLIYTSGTTGNSKGVMLSHRNITFDVVSGIEKFPIDSGDRFLSILPLAHTFEATGGMLCPVAVGASVYYLKGLPTPQKLLDAMAVVHPTAVLAVPLVIDKIFRKKIVPEITKKPLVAKLYGMPFFRRRLHRLAGKKLIKSFGGKLRFFMFGGAAMNPDTEQFLRDAEIQYSTGYGMTETAPIMTINPFGKVKVGSCGQPIPGIEMKIHDPDVHTGVGEIIVRGPIVMSGYFKNPESTTEVFLEGGWLRTGDLGRFDAEGYLFIHGRCKNVIVGPSGENIYPEIVEQLLLQSPYVQEVVVFMSEERLVAKAYLDYDVLDREFHRSNLDSAESGRLISEILDRLRRETNTHLPSFSALARIVEHPEPFEKTPTNKVKRYLYIPPPQ